jgi:Asp-tRNA(Asn)/Glu-tRNA(Gln) amidotransferase B subunit
MDSAGELSATQAKAVLAALADDPDGDPKAIAAKLGFEQLSDDTLATTVEAVISANGDEWARFAGGDDKLAQFFIGKVMAATKGYEAPRGVVVCCESGQRNAKPNEASQFRGHRRTFEGPCSRHVACGWDDR